MRVKPQLSQSEMTSWGTTHTHTHTHTLSHTHTHTHPEFSVSTEPSPPLGGTSFPLLPPLGLRKGLPPALASSRPHGPSMDLHPGLPRPRLTRWSWTRLCFTGCLSLSGPRSMTGIVGGSMSVECQYQEAFVDNIKYWCKHPCVSPWKIVETRESEREVRRGRVSIRDCPASLTFTVTLESLREEDAGTYRCGIYVPLSRDPTFQVEVSVIPGEPEMPALGLLTYLGP